MRRLLGTAAILAVITTVACASSSRGSEADQIETSPARRSSETLSELELRESSARSALEAVQQRRPQWLRSRGASSVQGAQPEVVVYLGEMRLGSVQSLTQFAVSSIKELRYYNATDATSRWGTGHSAGAIVVTLR
jgi:hypothetical protein